MPIEQPATPKWKLRWYQFSLRTMFVVTTAFALFLSWRSCLEYRRQAVIAEIKALGGTVTIGKPAFLPRFSGERVIDVALPYSEAKTFDVDRLRIFPSIQTITYNDVRFQNDRLKITAQTMRLFADKVFDGSAHIGQPGK